MFRTLGLKLSLLCVSLVALAGSAAAQPVTQPQFGAQSQPNAFSDELIGQIIHTIDPNAVMSVEADGSTLYKFNLKRDGVTVFMVVAVNHSQVGLAAAVSDPFPTNLSVEDINSHLVELNQKTAPVRIAGQKLQDGRGLIMASHVIDRSVSTETFAEQWNRFVEVAAGLRYEFEHPGK